MYFFGCNKVQEVWAEAGLGSFIQWWLDIADGFVSLFFPLLAVLLQHHMQQFVMALWCYMETKEREIVEQGGAMPVCVIQIARDSPRQWQQGSGLCREGAGAFSGNSGLKWEKPAICQVKCNIDAKIFKDQR
jgi:hypothetical protein